MNCYIVLVVGCVGIARLCWCCHDIIFMHLNRSRWHVPCDCTSFESLPKLLLGSLGEKRLGEKWEKYLHLISSEDQSKQLKTNNSAVLQSNVTQTPLAL